MNGQNYRDLVAWQKAMDLVVDIYRATEQWPDHEQYALTSQVHPAAISIPANIAEGQGRASAKEFLHYLSIAHGSLREVETYVLLGERLDYLDSAESSTLMAHAAEVGRLLNGLRKHLRASIASPA